MIEWLTFLPIKANTWKVAVGILQAAAGYVPVQGGQLYDEACGEGDALALIHTGIVVLEFLNEL